MESTMYMDSPEILIYVGVGAFLLGWLVGKIGAYFGNKFKARARDPRDDRIRSMDAELRVAQGSTEKARAKLDDESKALKEKQNLVASHDKTIVDLKSTVTKLKVDLKESVLKTRELREELTDRAAENIKSEVKLRDVETELSIARASTDLIATGVLDYTEDEDEKPSDVVKSAN
jgi:predicted transcriptional regulator